MIRSLFFDIDGTLVSFETHEIPESTVKALEQAKANGVSIYISTGRPISIITNLGAIGHLIDGYITTNGALCFVGEHTVCCNPVPQSDADTLLADAVANDYTCLVVGEHDVALFNHKHIFDEIFLEKLNVKGIKLDNPVSKIINDENPQRILQLSPFISAEHEKEIMAKMPGCQSGRWHPAFTDITSTDADKGKGLVAMANYLGMDISETMAFGDGGNDVTIIREAGIGVAMDNAGDDVKAVADYVTTHVDDNGIRNALEHFGVI